MLHFDGSIEKLTRIKVMGIGGGGCNAVDRMIASGFDEVEYACVNTDIQALYSNKALEKIQIGPKITKGLGAGGNPEMGRLSAEESLEEIIEVLDETDILFLMSGFGGGTGTGALPVISKAAKEKNILTIPVVTKPFVFEGRKRTQAANNGIQILNNQNDSIIVVPNEKLLRLISEDTSVQEAFLMTDKYLMLCVQSLHSLLSKPGLINVDFADVRTVMSHPGPAVLGQGTGEGKGKVCEAVQKALASPILEKDSLYGAKGLLIHVSGGKDVSLMEVNKAISEVEALTDKDANIIFGTTIDEKAENKAHVTIIATGLAEQVIKPFLTSTPQPEVKVEPLKPEIQPELIKEPEAVPELPEPEPEKLFEEEEPVQSIFESVKEKEETEPELEQEPEPEVEIKSKPLFVKPIEPKIQPKVPSTDKPEKEKQIILNFTPGQKGRFEKMEPTFYDGEDLDIPTFIRKKKMFERNSEENIS